ncbi:MAG: hypothetical protein A2646_03130 [Candidatus Portnoybacteria bacterium RIFCSPHIGHO2_02_FULL_39_12]|nr:MAG: hypothetical protein A2646_03130 [Candidatus Portnoybacteria bacterium RIFCSPHIGHO2_02_FULL_39_12]
MAAKKFWPPARTRWKGGSRGEFRRARAFSFGSAARSAAVGQFRSKKVRAFSNKGRIIKVALIRFVCFAAQKTKGCLLFTIKIRIVRIIELKIYFGYV